MTKKEKPAEAETAAYILKAFDVGLEGRVYTFQMKMISLAEERAMIERERDAEHADSELYLVWRIGSY